MVVAPEHDTRAAGATVTVAVTLRAMPLPRFVSVLGTMIDCWRRTELGVVTATDTSGRTSNTAT
jgi:hypothetical protein